MPKLGAYAREIILANPDQRTKEARLVRQMRRELAQHLGGEAKLTATQRVLVERAAMLQLRCALLDQKILDGGDSFTEHDSRTYLAWSNSLTRAMVALGLERTTRRQRKNGPKETIDITDLIKEQNEFGEAAE